jgi:hypothetical protein
MPNQHELVNSDVDLDTNFSTSVATKTWYVNSGASRHMTGHREWFTNFTELPAQHWPIKGISATPLYATGIRDIAIDHLIGDTWRLGYLENVLFVPGLDSNLFFVTRAATKNVNTICSGTGYIMTQQNIPVL